jgi:hypothetical protein
VLPLKKWRAGFLVREDEIIVAGREEFFERSWPKFWLPPKSGRATTLSTLDTKNHRIAVAWRAMDYAWPRVYKKERKDTLVSLESDANGRIYTAHKQSQRVLVLDKSLHQLLATHQLRGERKKHEILHVLPSPAGVFALFSDGQVWRCSNPCDNGVYEPSFSVSFTGELSSGSLVYLNKEKIGVLGVRAPHHSFRRRNVLPDRYWEVTLRAKKVVAALEIAQNYYSPATTAIPLSGFLGEVAIVDRPH